MSKKIILLALAAASVAACSLSATAMAAEEDVPLHIVPQLVGAKPIDGEGTATLTSGFGSVVCTSASGTATFENSTTGTLEQTLKGCTLGSSNCTTSGQATGVVTTASLPFHLVTVKDTPTGETGPGILVTTNLGSFASFTCGFLGFNVGGNGLIGTITKPNCGNEAFEATIKFSSSSTGVQTHRTVVGTLTEYSLETSASSASEDWSGVITFGQTSRLECT